MKLTTQTFMLLVTLFYCTVLCFFGCGAGEDLSGDGNLSGDKTLTLVDRDRILAEAIDWNNLQIRGPENEELIYEPNQETPYTGWVVRRWGDLASVYPRVGLGEEWQVEEIFQVRNGKVEGLYTGWLKNGQKWQEGTHKGGYREGMWIYWHENGQKAEEGEFKRNLTDDPERWRIPTRWHNVYSISHGKWIYWHENGQKQSEGTYENGKQEGLWTLWYENGQKRSEGTYENGKTEGMWTLWYENGQKRSEGTYENGEREGTWMWWTEDGELSEERWFGKAVFVSANPPDGSDLASNGTITVRFDNDPGEVRASAGVVSGSGKTRTIKGLPFGPGAFVIQFWWTNGDGSHILSYNILPPD